MRIRKRTPARAASPGPSPPLSPSPPPPPPLVMQPPKEATREEKDEEAEEKRVVLVAGDGGREDGRGTVPLLLPADSKNSATTDGLPKPAAAAARCSRNDGKRWRCKNSAVPGFLFCDRHVKWSTRPRQPTANRKEGKKKENCGVLDLERVPVGEEEQAADDKDMDHDDSAPRLVRHDDDGFQPGGRKRARCGGAGPAGGSVN